MLSKFAKGSAAAEAHVPASQAKQLKIEVGSEEEEDNDDYLASFNEVELEATAAAAPTDEEGENGDNQGFRILFMVGERHIALLARLAHRNAFLSS